MAKKVQVLTIAVTYDDGKLKPEHWDWTGLTANPVTVLSSEKPFPPTEER